MLSDYFFGWAWPIHAALAIAKDGVDSIIKAAIKCVLACALAGGALHLGGLRKWLQSIAYKLQILRL